MTFTLVNVHLYFGKFQNSKKVAERARYARRVLEIYALSKWADRRFNKDTTYDKEVILLGDMNVPKMDEEEATYKTLVSFGWQQLDYVSKTGGSNLGNDKTYDQMIFALGDLGERVISTGTFDFDKVLFKSYWKKMVDEHGEKKAVGKFNKLVKHHLSDHRPLWVQLDVT